MKQYRLLKELPTFHAGDIFTLGEDGCLYLTEPCDFNHHWKSRVMAYHKNTLANFPNILEDWFEEIESKEYWYIDYDGGILCGEYDNSSAEKMMISMGNHFETIEEAELAVRKLKAVAKLKEFGFRFIDWELDMKTVADGKIWFDIGINTEWDAERLLELKPEVKESLDLLFGGEE